MKSVRFIGVLTLSALLAGCGLSSPVKMNTVRTYSLTSVTPTKLAQRSRSSRTLLVTLPIPDAGFGSNQLIYKPLPYDFRYYADHQWAAPPAQMLLPLLSQAVRNQGYFKAVVATPFSGITDYHLDTRLISLAQNFLRPTSREQLVLQETLASNATNKVIASKQFSIYVSAPANNAYGGVVAANKAVSVLTGQVARWVIRSVG
ncbi:MAG: hypothetical protein COB66_02950 [Coxiella sp. (in: Bacteria)]|nr:MAG: hypothetical protein COB66_02950 [Coxiella sp. (in: g-proteobacteria)]